MDWGLKLTAGCAKFQGHPDVVGCMLLSRFSKEGQGGGWDGDGWLMERVSQAEREAQKIVQKGMGVSQHAPLPGRLLEGI